MGSDAAAVTLTRFLLEAPPPDPDPGLTSEWLPGAILVIAVVGAGSIWHWRRRRRPRSATPAEPTPESDRAS